MCTGTLNGSSDGEWIPANSLSWSDGAAYAAWAGLRPFTELEYEKAARGPSNVDQGIPNEFSWGSSEITQVRRMRNGGQNLEESIDRGNGLCNFGGIIKGPIREAGCIPSSTTERLQKGASYWGIMSLSGNVDKPVVTIGNKKGREFKGSHGTGVLSTDGNATNKDWPGYVIDAGEVFVADGSGFRGGDWNGTPPYSISERWGAAFGTEAKGDVTYGARFARTAP